MTLAIAAFVLSLAQTQEQEQIPTDLTKGERFIWTVHRDDFEAFKRASDGLGKDLERLVDEFWTPLSYAAVHGGRTHVAYLLGKGAKPDGRNKDGSTALMRAAMTTFDLGGGVSPVLKQLIEAGASLRAKDDQGSTALHYAASWPMYDFSYQGQEDAYVRTANFFALAGAVVDERDNAGMTPLLCAFRRGHFEMVVGLQSLGADLGARDKLGRSALTFVADWPETDRLRLLVLKSDVPVTPMDVVLMGDVSRALGMLKGGTERLSHGPRKESPLSLAAATGSVELLRAVLRYNTDPNFVDERRETAMFAAVGVTSSASQLGYRRYNVSSATDEACAEIVGLIAKSGGKAHVFVKPSEDDPWLADHDTPLYRAAGAGRILTVKALLTAGARPNGSGEQYPLEIAAAQGHLEVVKALLAAGADPKKGSPLSRLESGSWLGWPEVNLEDRAEIAKILKAAGAGG